MDANNSEGSVAPQGEAETDLPEPKWLAFVRRNVVVLTGVAVAFVVGPSLTRMLESYRAVVLEVTEEGTLVAYATKPPKRLDRMDVTHGSVLQKDAGAWSPRVVEPNADDAPLLKLHARYVASYEGVISAIRPPVYPNGPSVAEVLRSDGQKIDVEIWTEALATAAVGKRLRKDAGAWDPVLVVNAGAPAPPQ